MVILLSEQKFWKLYKFDIYTILLFYINIIYLKINWRKCQFFEFILYYKQYINSHVKYFISRNWFYLNNPKNDIFFLSNDI